MNKFIRQLFCKHLFVNKWVGITNSTIECQKCRKEIEYNNIDKLTDWHNKGVSK